MLLNNTILQTKGILSVKKISGIKTISGTIDAISNSIIYVRLDDGEIVILDPSSPDIISFAVDGSVDKLAKLKGMRATIRIKTVKTILLKADLVGQDKGTFFLKKKGDSKTYLVYPSTSDLSLFNKKFNKKLSSKENYVTDDELFNAKGE